MDPPKVGKAPVHRVSGIHHHPRSAGAGVHPLLGEKEHHFRESSSCPKVRLGSEVTKGNGVKPKFKPGDRVAFTLNGERVRGTVVEQCKYVGWEKQELNYIAYQDGAPTSPWVISESQMKRLVKKKN
jgi:hypothetical protein